jgi:hypothetical protein
VLYYMYCYYCSFLYDCPLSHRQRKSLPSNVWHTSLGATTVFSPKVRCSPQKWKLLGTRSGVNCGWAHLLTSYGGNCCYGILGHTRHSLISATGPWENNACLGHLEEAIWMKQTQNPNFFSTGSENNAYQKDKCVSHWWLLEEGHYSWFYLTPLDVAYITPLILQNSAKNKFFTSLFLNRTLQHNFTEYTDIYFPSITKNFAILTECSFHICRAT